MAKQSFKIVFLLKIEGIFGLGEVDAIGVGSK